MNMNELPLKFIFNVLLLERKQEGGGEKERESKRNREREREKQREGEVLIWLEYMN